MAKDPYRLLNVAKTATDAEIRKAYRKLAKELHPDVKPNDPVAGERFKEISAAYSLLTDKDLRAQYDSGQVDSQGQRTNPFGGHQHRASRGTHPGEMEDLFSSLFGMNTAQRGGPFGGGFQRQAPRPQKGADVRYKVTLSFLEALSGGSRKLTGGDGNSVNIKIPAGIKDGQSLRLRGKGRAGINGGPAGDAKIDVTVKTHKYFSREGDTIRLILPISLQEAVLGAKIIVPMPTGDVQVRIPTGTNSGQTLRVKGKGVDGADLYLKIQIVLEDPKSPELQKWAKENKAHPDFLPRNKLVGP